MDRPRWGALAWLLTLQFFVVETLVESRYGRSYSRLDDVISALGGSDSPAAAWMNASFVAQGVLIAAGALLLRPVLPRRAGSLAVLLLTVAGLGVLVVGVVPLDAGGSLHALGAGLYLFGGGLGLLALAHAVRPRSEAVGTGLALLGLLGTAATILFVAGITGPLGAGGMERAAAYVVPVALPLAAVLLWGGKANGHHLSRSGDAGDGDGEDGLRDRRATGRSRSR